MARALRVNYPGAVYHVTCRGNERRAIVTDDADRHAWIRRLRAALETYRVTLYVYVLMDNHFHLVVETPQANLSEMMRYLNVAYTGDFNRRHQRVGHLYQGRFKAILVDAETYLVELSRYVHLNPIRVAREDRQPISAQLRRLRRYPWSSLSDYLNGRTGKSGITLAPVLASFGGETVKGRRAYAAFVEEGARRGVASPWERVTGQVLLGSETFVERIRARIGRPNREQPALRALATRWTPEAVLACVARIVEQPVQTLGERRGGWPRAIAMECLHRYAHESQAAIGRRLGGVDYSWVSRQRARLAQEVVRDGDLRTLLRRIEAALGDHE